MNLLSFGTTLKAAIVAAVVAALIVGVFHRVVTEPLIDQAIVLEEQAGGHADEAEPLVDRDTQRFGLLVGMLLYGLTWALFFAVAYHVTQQWLPAGTPGGRGALLALGAYFSVALFPFVKYPANPPGVGEPDSILLRQGLYVLAIAIGVAAVTVAFAIASALRSRERWLQVLAPIACLAGIGLFTYLVLPANPDAIRMPMDIVSAFRGLSLAGLTLFWLLFAAGFVVVVRRGEQHPVPATS